MTVEVGVRPLACSWPGVALDRLHEVGDEVAATLELDVDL